MVTSRSAIAVVLFAGCLQSSASADTILDQSDLIPLGHALGRSPVDISSQGIGPIDADLGRDPVTRPLLDRHVEPTRFQPIILSPAPTSMATWTTTTSPPISSLSVPNPDSGPPIAPVPEPSGMARAISGLGALAFIAGRRWFRRA